MKVYITGDLSSSNKTQDIEAFAAKHGFFVSYDADSEGEDAEFFSALKQSIKVVFNLEFDCYTALGKSSTMSYFAKLIFTHFCLKSDISVIRISKMLNRSEVSVYRYVGNFESEQNYNRDFRKFVKMVDSQLQINLLKK
jgi:hypothetical protein